MTEDVFCTFLGVVRLMRACSQGELGTHVLCGNLCIYATVCQPIAVIRGNVETLFGFLHDLHQGDEFLFLVELWMVMCVCVCICMRLLSSGCKGS